MHPTSNPINHAALIKAAKDDITVLTNFLDSDPEAVNQVDNHLLSGKTLIHHVFDSCGRSVSDFEKFKPIIGALLSRKNINFNTQDISGNTPLHTLFSRYTEIASSFDYILLFTLPLLKGHFIDTTLLDMHGMSFLHRVANHQTSILESYDTANPTRLVMLLSELDHLNLDVLSDEGATALAYAVKNGNVSNIRALIQAGANASLHESSDFNVLTLLPDLYNHIDFTKSASYNIVVKHTLEKAKSDILKIISDIKASKPIQQRFKALLKMDARRLRKILAHDSTILTAQDEDGMTLYHHLANLKRHSELNPQVADLLFSQISVNLSLQDYAGNTPLHLVLKQLAIKHCFPKAAVITYPRFIELMKRTGFDYSIVNKAKSSVYHLASDVSTKIKHYDPLSLLLEGSTYHPIIDEYDKQNDTALTLACRNQTRQRRHIECLVNHGASANIMSNYQDDEDISPYGVIEDRIENISRQLTLQTYNVDDTETSQKLETTNRKLANHERLLRKMEYPALFQEALAYQEIGRTAATLSQSIRDGHSFSFLPKTVLVKFSIFSTRAYYGSSRHAKKIAVESLEFWLAAKTPKK